MIPFVILIKFAHWETWTGDTSPIVHGGYISNWYGQGVTDNYTYWHVESPVLFGINVYSNGDKLLSYKSKIVNNPFTKFESPFGSNFIVRIDKANGKTIWAKEILFNPNGIYFLIIKTLIVNDIAWSLFIYASKGINAPGIITRTDFNGNLIEMFYIPFYVSPDSNINYYFNVVNFYLFSDLSFIAVADWLYYEGQFGVSQYSLTDLCLFKIDSNRNFKWSSSIDFLSKSEEHEGLYEYNNTFYVSFVTAQYYYWLTILNKDTGVFENWSWAYVYKLTNNSVPRSLIIFYASERFIYAVGDSYQSDSLNPISLYLFDPITLKLIKAYNSDKWFFYFGFNMTGLSSDELYWVSANYLYR